MSQNTWPDGSYGDLADLAERRDALRQAAVLPGADPRVLLDAAFAELDAAVEMLAKLARETGRQEKPAGAGAVEAITRRMDMVTALTRLLLDNSTFSEAVTLQRCARLLAGGIASWVIVDIERSGELRRQVVVGPPGEQAGEVARKVRDAETTPESVPARVHAAGRSVVLAHADDAGILGTAPGGTPVLMLLSAASVLCVPISGDGTGYGDFYDVFPVEGGWAITVGDVCGKGQEAAAMTAAARHAIRVIAHWSPDPVDVLAKVNEVILAGDYEERFVTVKLAYLRWDGDRVRVELASSGHPGPAVVRPDGRVDVLSGGGLPLGLFPDAEPERETLELEPDDLLFFYSDGVTEARSPDMRYFEDRLADELAGLAGRPAAEATRMIQGLVSEFTEDDLRDDMTILVARVRHETPDS